MTDERRRKSLTPLESELRFPTEVAPARPSTLERIRRPLRRERRPPQTLRRAIAAGVLRLVIALGLASVVALLVDHWMHRQTALGFYIVGGALLGVAVLMSAGDVGTPYYYGQGERERRVSMSFAYVLAGLVVIAIGVAIEATR